MKVAVPRVEPAAPAAPAARAPRALYEHGLTCAALGDHQAAIAALRDAVAQKPGLAGAWSKLAELYRLAGDAPAAAAALARYRACDGAEAEARPAKPQAPGKIEAAERQLRARLASMRPGEAGPFLRDRLRQNPADAAALRLLGEAALARGDNHAAEAILARGVELAPDHAAIRHLYAVTLFRLGREAQALPHAEWLVARDRRNVSFRILLASSLATIGEVARAAGLYAAILKDAPDHPTLWLNYGQALKHAGQRAESEAAFRRCLALSPKNGDAHWSLQNLSQAPAAPEDLAAMRAQLAAGGLPPESRFHFHYALAYALEKSAEYAESFSHYAQGAKIWRGMLTYSAEETSERVRRAAAFFTPARFAATAGAGCPDPAPVFIVGMPRAGSTLIEQILASHSQVEGTQELPEIRHIVEALDRRLDGGYPECLAAVTPEELAALGARYIAQTRIYRRTGKPYFVDKMPANWANIGLIRMILPNAKIIDARREPMANCFAAFKKFFSTGQSFTYDLEELGRYYGDYAGLMAHVDATLPGHVHRVVYEDMVADTEAEIRRLLAYCGLAFEPACLRFWESTRAVTTASADQVRRPIFRDGLAQWRHFDPWLGTLRAALSSAGIEPAP